MKIESMSDLEQAALDFGILPFFRNNIRGFSVEEMTPPSLLFGGNDYEGCWEWKGPVIRKQTVAYGKFFKKKAGFVSLELLPHFLNIRRNRLHILPGSREEMLLDIIGINDGISSTELRASIFGGGSRKRTAHDLPEYSLFDSGTFKSGTKVPSRHSLEAPLQRLQMGGKICISDFIYKHTKKGERYGWGVAVYSVPESIYPISDLETELCPEESLQTIIRKVCNAYPAANETSLKKLLDF